MANLKSFIQSETKKLDTAEKSPETKAPKDFTSFNIKRATPEDMRVLNVAWAVKAIREKNGMAFTNDDVEDIRSYAVAKGTKALATADIGDLIPSGVTGQLILDAWNDVKLSALIPMEEVVDVSVTRALQDTRLSVFRVGEGQDATESSQTFTHFRYVVDKIMAYAVITTESLEDSIIDLAVGVIRDMQQGFAEAFENAIINGHNVVAEFDGTEWDLKDIDGNTVTSANPISQFKGVRRLGYEKSTVDFGEATADLTDQEFLGKVHEMQRAGGKYFTINKVSMGEVALFVDLQTYQRISRMDYFTDASKRGSGSTVAGGQNVYTFDGIPVYQLDFMPTVSKVGIIQDGTAGKENIYGSMVMANVKYLKAYMKTNSTTVKTDENIKNDTQAWAMRTRAGFGGLYDSTETNFPVDTTRKYVVLGINIK